MLAAVPKPKRLKDPKVLKEMRSDRCEICRERAGCEVHHIISAGSGGPDHPYNLIALCKWKCHIKAHSGGLSKAFLFGKVALREGTLYEVVVETVRRLKT
jgi:hypothetical protein